MEIYPFVLQKMDESPEECEDRLAIASDIASHSVRASVADGATATAFSGRWAELLVETYCDRPFVSWDDIVQRAELAAKRWASDVFSGSRPWHALQRAQTGAAAAIAAIEVNERERQWTASALGDSCVFHVRANRIIDMLPMYSAEDFGNSPRLISTNVANNAALRSEYVEKAGTYLPGDRFVLATDAAAEALVRRDQHSNGIADWLDAMRSGEPFAREFIEALRDGEAIRNDDIAIVVIAV